MPRKSKREIEATLDALEPQSDVPAEVGPVEQWFSDDYPDPPMSELGDAWAEQLESGEGEYDTKE